MSIRIHKSTATTNTIQTQTHTQPDGEIVNCLSEI